MRMLRSIALPACIAILLLTAVVVARLPSIAASALANVGYVTLSHVLIPAQLPQDYYSHIPMSYPYWGIADPSGPLVGVRSLFRGGVALDGRNHVIRRGLGRVALALGDGFTAADALAPLEAEASDNPPLFFELLTAYSRAGEGDRVIALYEWQGPSVVISRAISDTVALAYLGRAKELLDAGNTAATEHDLFQVIALRLGDLYANYLLWQGAQQTGNLVEADAYKRALIYFPVEAIQPADERLLDYAADVIPALLEQGLWDTEKALNVISLWVWQRSLNGAERAIELLLESHPNEQNLYVYKGLVEGARGEHAKALESLAEARARDMRWASVYLENALTYEELGDLAKAETWLEEYHRLAPDDLLGLKKLAETYEALGKVEEAQAWQERLEKWVDDVGIVAEALGIEEQSFELGENLIDNGEFEDGTSQPSGWSWAAMVSSDVWSEGMFTGGLDRSNGYGSSRSLRIAGFWTHQEQGKERARAGYWQRAIELDPSALYLLTFYYKTRHLQQGEAAVYFLGKYHHLPSTYGSWRKFNIVGRCEMEASECVGPFLANFGAGTVWYDGVSLREVHLTTKMELMGDDFKMVIR